MILSIVLPTLNNYLQIGMPPFPKSAHRKELVEHFSLHMRDGDDELC